ncbi:MAG TPA: hypothetical protein VF076_04375 [Acidimicrobiales bacterium]
MRRIGTVLAAITVGALAAPLLAGPAGAATPPPPQLTNVTAHTSGPELEIDFVERNLVPGQNYAYVGSSSKAIETIQCYRSSTFTPLPHIYKLSTTVTVPDTRGYTADANGVVRGFVFVENGIVLRNRCKAGQDAVPIHVTFVDFQLVDVFTANYVQVSGRFSGPIEPD